MFPRPGVKLLSALLVIVGVSAGPLRAQAQNADKVDFSREIQPLLSNKCYACHGPDDKTREAEFRLDVAESALDADKAAIVPGKPDSSELIRRIMSNDPDEMMPPPSTNKSLSQEEKQRLSDWVQQGADWAVHWAYIPPVKKLPAGSPSDQQSAPQSPSEAIDRFILARLTQQGLTASPEADRVTLIRRLYFDLIGLPPTYEQVQAFVEDNSPGAYDRVVDELLSSPHFGERMAIYWLDVVRFADSNGYHSDKPRQVAPFRDYVINSFNVNKPYDQFVIEQLAGDLLPNPGIEAKIASGFNMLLQTTDEGGAQAKEYLAKYSADRVRNTSQIFLGSTMGCSECHNHKFDPFTQKDFYSFAAFFADIQEVGVGNPPAFEVARPEDEARFQKLTESIAVLRKRLDSPAPELIVAQKAWEAETLKANLDAPEYSEWSMIGPFKGSSFDDAYSKAFIDPASIDLKKPVGKLKWKAAPELADNKTHSFANTDNSARYLYRTINVSEPAELALAIGSDDSLTVWVNGKKVHDNKVSRGVMPGQDKFNVQLQAGENQLLMKVANGGGGFGFAFSSAQNTLPGNVLAALRVDESKRNKAQAAELAKYYRSIAPLLQPTRDEIAKLEARLKAERTALPKTLMTRSGKPRMIRLLNRGNWLDDSGEVMQPAIPAFLGQLNPEGRAPNRLDLAKWIVARENPLTARTYVNRLWKLFFGHGLATPLDDLGRQGTLPTHPELLDWMAVEFMESGWDVKHMVRVLVKTKAYRQSSLETDQLKTLDPYNELYGRQSRFRLDAEMVRDNALSISGLLVTEIGGRSVYPYQPAGYWQHMNFPARTWKPDSGDNQYRRGLYTWWQRMFLHPSMLAFDAPSREECTVERPRSNIPQQALVLLNDPTYVEAARAFGRQIAAAKADNFESRLDWAYRKALSRSPAPRETAVMRAVFDKHLAGYKSDSASAGQLIQAGDDKIEPGELARVAAWTSIARIILNLHETITRS